MKKMDGTVTLSILDEDNHQRIIFRIIPLCTKDGLIFKNRKTSYPDYGSLRIIPDKREQSSFKDRMREMGKLCCVQLLNDGKELTKIRQNRNYDPNQDECNQFAIYSDVICGFENEAIFEVFQEDADHSIALTDEVLIQKGKVLFGPVVKGETILWDTLKPFGNENYLMHTVEDTDGLQRTYYWNPDALITWRQRKKENKRSAAVKRDEHSQPAETPAPGQPTERIPIGTRLEILNDELSTAEQITELNLPVSVDANRLEDLGNIKEIKEPEEAHKFQGTPIADALKAVPQGKMQTYAMHGVVEKQLNEKQSGTDSPTDKKPLLNPIDSLRAALQNVWNIPSLHPAFIQLLSENTEMTKAILESKLVDYQTKSAYSAAKAELDEIEGERISLLVELDKVKTDYQQTKEKMYQELASQKQNEIEAMDNQIAALQKEKNELEEMLLKLGEEVQAKTIGYFQKKQSMDIKSNGSDVTVSPLVGSTRSTGDIVEAARSALSSLGFACKQDCVTEFMVFLSLYDEFCMLGNTMQEAELYLKTILRTLGLLNVAAWSSVFGTLNIVSFLPENDQRTPTLEVSKNNRAPINAYGHKTIRLIDHKQLQDAVHLPIVRVPALNRDRGLESSNEPGKPISLQAIHAFSKNADLLYKDGEEWFDHFSRKLKAKQLDIHEDVIHTMRLFARVSAPQLIGGFMEAADAAVLAWIVPVLLRNNYPQDNLEELIGDLPKCMYVMRAGNGSH